MLVRSSLSLNNDIPAAICLWCTRLTRSPPTLPRFDLVRFSFCSAKPSVMHLEISVGWFAHSFVHSCVQAEKFLLISVSWSSDSLESVTVHRPLRRSHYNEAAVNDICLLTVKYDLALSHAPAECTLNGVTRSLAISKNYVNGITLEKSTSIKLLQKRQTVKVRRAV